MSIKCLLDTIHNNQTYLSIVGLLAIFYLALKLSWKIWLVFKAHFLSQALNLNSKFLEKGTWAVVTGATDGIGKAYAEQLAARGLNVVLISRSIEKLNDVAKSIGDKFVNVQLKCIAADFSEGYSIYQNIEKQLQGLDVSLLVNNVGVSYEKPDFLSEISDGEIEKMIVVNCFSVTFMTKLVLNGMLNHRKGVIVNIASQSALFPVPLLSVYSASKAYVLQFTDAMNCEYTDKGITFQCVSPGYVVTKLSKLKHPSFFAPSPETYAKAAIATIGIVSNTSGYLAHSIQEMFILALPRWLMLSMITKTMKDIRAKALARNPKKEKSTDCDSALIPLLCVHG